MTRISLVTACALLALAGCASDDRGPTSPAASSVPIPPSRGASADLAVIRDMAPTPTPSPVVFPTTAAVTVGPGGTLTYAPQTVDIAAGGTVTWTWAGGVLHSVTSDTGLFDSGIKSTGTFTVTFPTAGTFPYHCAVHGLVMSGTVVVH
jgi:plastocyanin